MASKAKSLSEKANSPKNLALAERNRTAIIGAGEPVINLNNYDSDLMYAFSYYNIYTDDKDKRKWVMKYLAKDKEAIAKLSDVSDFDLRQPAILIRLAERGQPLNPKHVGIINEKLTNCFNKVEVQKTAKINTHPFLIKPIATIATRIDAIATTHIADIEYELDLFILNKKSDFSMRDYVASKQVNGPTAKIIAKWFTKTLNEVGEAIEGNDEQLVESYSFLKPGELKKFHKLISSIVDECVQQKVKVVRKARKVKIKPASEVVKRVKYLPEYIDETLTLKSEHPVKLVNSTEVWLYNTKTRRATMLKAVDNDILVVKGSSIINFDIGKSETRTLRKPEEFFKIKLAKRDMVAAWKLLKTKPVAAKGRINGDTIIIAAFI